MITAAWLQLTPAPEAAWPVIGFFDGVRGGVGAIERVIGTGLPVAALEYIDSEAMRYASASFPGEVPEGGFAVLAEADGSIEEAARIRKDVLDLFGEDALALYAPEAPQEIAALWRWRDGLALVVDAQRGGKASEDIAVPLDRLGEAIEESLEIGRRLGVRRARGVTRATATCTRVPACGGRRGRARPRAETLRRSFSSSPCDSVGRFPVSTASAS